jgi:Uma2 family endonuclease
MLRGALLKEQYEEGRHFTYSDYKDWASAPGERFELIYGEAYDLAAPSSYHQSILTELVRQFANFFVGKPCPSCLPSEQRDHLSPDLPRF